MIIRAKAPLRISFCGGGTDVKEYFTHNTGMVLSSTINRYAFTSIIPNNTREIEVHSLDYNIVEKYNCDEDLYNCEGGLELVKSTLAALNVSSGCQVYLHNDAPPGSGLGSSSAMVVSMISAVSEWQGLAFDNYEISELAYKIEREDLKIAGGYQDQYGATFGGFNFIEFSKDAIVVNPLIIKPDIINELEYNLLMCYTGGIRLSSKIIDDQVNNYIQKKEDVIHAMDELKTLTVEMKKALLRGNLDDFGALLHDAWINKKMMSSKISNTKIDELYAEALNSGALGGKLLGAGGGGYLLLYCPYTKKHVVSDRLEKMGAQVAAWNFELKGVQSWKLK